MSLRDFFHRRTQPIEPPFDLGGPDAPGVRIPQEGFLTDWRAGDLGVCISNGAWFQPTAGVHVPGPKPGQIVRVLAVHLCHGCACLFLKGWGDGWFQASCFRKLDEKGEEKWLGAVKRKHAPKEEELA